MPQKPSKNSHHFRSVFLLAILIRIILVPFFYHPDIKSQNFHFQFFSQGHFNIYQYIADNKKALPYKDTFNYLPLTYYTFGFIQSLLNLIMPPDFLNWINDWSSQQNNYINLPYFMLILKIPYILLDLGIFWLIYKITSNRKLSILWLFNPISFYLIYILGNFDILPVFLTLLSYYLLSSRPKTSFFVFGLAIAIKLYPLIFLPFLLLSSTKKIPILIKNSLIALIPLIVTIFPYLFTQTFWISFLGSGLTQKIIETKIHNIPLFPVLYMFIFITYLFTKNKVFPKIVFYLFLLFVSLVHFHPQWLLWFFPFLFLLNTKFSPQIPHLLLILFLSLFLYIALFNDTYLSWGHLLPIDNGFLLNTAPYNLIRYRLLLDPQIFQNNIRVLISAFSFILFFYYEKTSHTNHH